jgi:hypothetical protein
VQKKRADLKGIKMKNLMKKMLLVLSAMVIAFGSITMVAGCKKKEASGTPQKETPKEKEILDE